MYRTHLAKSNANLITDPSSPYYLYPIKNPGISLTSMILNTQNYNTWFRTMWLALKLKNKLKFVDGTFKKSNKSDPLSDAWDRCNTYIVSQIKLSLSSKISQSVIWNDIAANLWRDLTRRYYQGDRFVVAMLQEQISSIKQCDLSVISYFTELRSLWEELENFRLILRCACGEICTCGLGVVRGYKCEDYAVRFLKGLNE